MTHERLATMLYEEGYLSAIFVDGKLGQIEVLKGMVEVLDNFGLRIDDKYPGLEVRVIAFKYLKDSGIIKSDGNGKFYYEP